MGERFCKGYIPPVMISLFLGSLWISPVLAQEAEEVYQQGLTALRAKDAQAAREALSRCIALEPERSDCYWELGWAHVLSGQWREAVAAWEKVEMLRPDHPELHEHLANARAQVEMLNRIRAMEALAPATVERGSLPSTTLRIRAVGDMMLGTTFPEGYLPPDDGALLLAPVLSLLSDSDLTFANLEGPLCDHGETNKCREGGNCYAFRSPTHYGQYLREAGIDVVSTANNHSSDFGELCRDETHATLDALGILWSGPPGTVATMEVEGLSIGLVAFHTSPACNYLNDQATATALIEAAANSHDLVIVSFHGGAEGSRALHVPRGRETFYGEDRGDLRAFSHAAIDAGADLVLGHGPHVPRGMEIYDGRLVAYSLGNFATYGRFNLSGNLGVGLVLEAILDEEGRLLEGRILPTRQVGRGHPEPDPEDRAIDLIRMLSLADFPTLGILVAEDGRFGPRD